MVYGSRLLRADWIINSPLSQPNGHAPGSMSSRGVSKQRKRLRWGSRLLIGPTRLVDHEELFGTARPSVIRT